MKGLLLVKYLITVAKANKLHKLRKKLRLGKTNALVSNHERKLLNWNKYLIVQKIGYYVNFINC